MFTHQIQACLAPRVARGEGTEKRFQEVLHLVQPVMQNLREKKLSNQLPLLNLPYETEDIAGIKAVAETIRNNFRHVVVMGTGGSSLNGQTLAALANPFTQQTQLHFADNIDPHSFDQLLEALPLSETAFLCISKSGQTVETLAQVLIVLNRCKTAGSTHIGSHFFLITDPIDNSLRRIGTEIGATILDHTRAIGGRFSALTNVGLLPALIVGLDAESFRAGAREIVEEVMNFPVPEAAKGAALSYTLMGAGYDTSVMMPYVDRLGCFASWYRQIWAESLGKNGVGTTPIKAMGTIDQHSQLQLYLDGPRNKMFTFITLDTRGQGAKITAETAKDKTLSYIYDKYLGDIIFAEQHATVNTLIKNHCPVRTIALDRLDECVLGGLLMHSMLETIIMAELLKVNAFDQPAVEEGKILTRQLLEAVA